MSIATSIRSRALETHPVVVSSPIAALEQKIRRLQGPILVLGASGFVAIGAAAALSKVPLRMADIKVTTTVRLHKEESGFFIDASLNCELNGVDQAQAEKLVAQAHTICPYSKATHGNINLVTTVKTESAAHVA